jgi:hypothetical protein
VIFLKRNGLKLQLAISLFVILIVSSSTIVSWYSTTSALKATLAENYLESNYNYAKKLSMSTSDLLSHMHGTVQSLAFVAARKDFNQAKLESWKEANTRHFNSMFMTDENGVIQYMSPRVIRFKDGIKIASGIKIQTETFKKALASRQPFMSEPYRATSGQLIMLLSAPIFNDIGQYKGLIGGTIYLESENVLKNTLNLHEYSDGSYVYVIDRSGRLIYHPDSDRINEIVTNNKIVRKVMQGKSGAAKVTNTKGKKFFAGYAYVDKTGWGIISQTPTYVIEKPLGDLLKNLIYQSLPLFILI